MGEELNSSLRRAIDALAEAIILVGTEGDVLYANPAAQPVLGCLYAHRNVHGWVGASLTTLSGEACPYAALPVILGLTGAAHAVLMLREKGTRARILELASRQVRGSDGSTLASISIVRDITALHDERVELVRARTFLDSIVENIPDMVFVKDAEHLRFDRFNRAGEELLGTPREEMIGKTDHDFFPTEQASFFQQRDRETLAAGRLVVIDEEPIDTRRGRRWLQTKKIPIMDEAGRPKYLLGISSDITARRDAEEALKRAHEELELRVATRTAELRQAEEQLRQAQKMDAVGQLAGGVAHDFNNVLAVILGYGQLLRERVVETDPLRPGIDAIITAAEHAAALTRQLLAFSRRRALQPRAVNLNQVIADAQVMLSPLLGEDISLLLEPDHELSQVHVDPSLMEQVVVNLAVNARDAMPGGGALRIGTRNVQVHESELSELHGLQVGPHVLLFVQDTGVGMSEEVRARVFEPFFTTKEATKGTGLGMAMVYGVVTQSGGAIRLMSQIGHGTRVEIYLPRRDTLTSMAVTRPVETRNKRAAHTVLVVEDEGPLRGVLREMLEVGGYTVLEAASGVEALEVAALYKGEIHLLLSDVIMPGMSGAQLARSLQMTRKATRLLFMSGYASDRLASHAPLGTGDSYLHKPFTQEALFAAVEEALDNQK